MINLQKLEYMEHELNTENNYANPIKHIEFNNKHYRELSPQLEGKYSKAMPTFWNTPIHEQWEGRQEDGCDMKVVRMNSVEEYDEQTINNTAWAKEYANVPKKKLIPDDVIKRIERENTEHDERILKEIRRTMRIVAGFKP